MGRVLGFSLASALLLLFVASPPMLQAQAEPGHVYQLIHWKAYPGSEAEYSQAYREVVRPIWSDARENGAIVSFLELSKNTGDTGEASHLILTEFEDWEALGNFGQALERASQQIFGRPYAEVSAERFVPLREAVKTEIYVAPPGGM